MNKEKVIRPNRKKLDTQRRRKLKMTRNEILSALKPYFKISELVCPHTLTKWGERSWQFLDTAFLHNLLIIRRDILQAPMICNTSTQTQRGLRCNLCPIVKAKTSVYLSAHIQGKAGDFIVKGISAEQSRQKIIASSNLLPYQLRIERSVPWLHIDVLPQYGNLEKISLFG